MTTELHQDREATWTLVDAVASLLLARAGEWVDAMELATVGGAMAWRTRLSDARRKYGLITENRIRTHRDPVTGRSWRTSEYRIPAAGPQVSAGRAGQCS